MSKRKEKLDRLITDVGQKQRGDAQFGDFVLCRTITKPERRKLARRMMRLMRQVRRVHQVDITAWAWVESPGNPGSADPLGRSSCLGVKLYGARA